MKATAALLALLASAASARADPQANAEAQRCAGTVGETAVAACRRALELGLSPGRAAHVERLLSARLGGLGRWEEAAEVHRRAIARRPAEAEPHRRLGAVLLHGLGRAREAEAELREALRLGSAEARTHGDLGLALLAQDRYAEAVAAFDAARAVDPKYLDRRPGSRAAYDAAKAGKPWPAASPKT
jgi:tetratricopeptide (TPR) repeat protein